ncbi:MAG: tetratricopeptide repeat protein [Planctomycetaceae bacterium]|nr:tetratricopeptide repeat protein [Planctomycetaceae bacterium]
MVLSVLAVAAAVVAGLVRARGAADPPERFPAALAALKQGDFKLAHEALRRMHARPESDPQLRLLRGSIQLHSGQPQEALHTLSSGRFEGELRVPSLELICESLYRLGDLTAAEAVARQLSTEDPENVDAHRWLAAVYYDLGANNAAIAELGLVTALAPDDYRPRHMLGVIYGEFEKFADAARQLRKAFELNPPAEARDLVVRDLVQSLVRTHEFEAALEIADAEDDGNDAALLALAAECHWGLGREHQARSLLSRALELAPGERTALLLQARLETESGDAQTAIAPLLQQLQLDPHDYECRYRLALVYRRLNRTADYEAQLVQLENSKKLRIELSDLSERAVDQPRNPEVRDQIAVLYDRLGKPEVAEQFRRAARACRTVRDGDQPGS